MTILQFPLPAPCGMFMVIKTNDTERKVDFELSNDSGCRVRDAT